MAKKHRLKRPYSEMTEEEWRELGKRMEERSKEFAEEIEQLGKRFGMNAEHLSRRHERYYRERWFETFGLIGPLIGSIFGIIFLSFSIWVLDLINASLASTFISEVSNFLFMNIHWFFAAFLFFGYSNYFSRKFSKTYWLISPIIGGLGAVFVIWIAVSILSLINKYSASNFVSLLSSFLYRNLWGIFFVLMVFGYCLIIFRKLLGIE